MTTMYEVGRIAGVTASKQRLVGVNLTGGPVNSIEIMTEVMKAPDPFQLLEAFEAELMAPVEEDPVHKILRQSSVV
jgi:hypothetical protein